MDLSRIQCRICDDVGFAPHCLWCGKEYDPSELEAAMASFDADEDHPVDPVAAPCEVLHTEEVTNRCTPASLVSSTPREPESLQELQEQLEALNLTELTCSVSTDEIRAATAEIVAGLTLGAPSPCQLLVGRALVDALCKHLETDPG